MHTYQSSAAQAAEPRVVAVLDYLATILERPVPGPAHDPLLLAVAVAESAPDARGVGVISNHDGTPRPLAASTRTAAALDHHQCATARGPSVDALTQGATLHADRTTLHHRWPTLARPAHLEGVHSCLAVPVTLGEHRSATVTLYGTSPTGFTPLERALLRATAAALTRTATDAAHARQANQRADHIHHALTTRAVIDQAKGLLMALHGIDA
ncbi:GAF and ANTAR domain-containing protein, partial [Streptomyces sp. SID3343]|uniref:GAF domain-containing protein n=1 Tax=Streptomyces sp. SID3343 TaxID=2690260 RepID=UPI0013696EF6|nr:GAF domain-containing protein [Streptomyces sp. SID3343]